jgi:hypothetical protein
MHILGNIIPWKQYPYPWLQVRFSALLVSNWLTSLHKLHSTVTAVSQLHSTLHEAHTFRECIWFESPHSYSISRQNNPHSNHIAMGSIDFIFFRGEANMLDKQRNKYRPHKRTGYSFFTFVQLKNHCLASSFLIVCTGKATLQHSIMAQRTSFFVVTCWIQ